MRIITWPNKCQTLSEDNKQFLQMIYNSRQTTKQTWQLLSKITMVNRWRNSLYVLPPQNNVLSFNHIGNFFMSAISLTDVKFQDRNVFFYLHDLTFPTDTKWYHYIESIAARELIQKVVQEFFLSRIPLTHLPFVPALNIASVPSLQISL